MMVASSKCGSIVALIIAVCDSSLKKTIHDRNILRETIRTYLNEINSNIYIKVFILKYLYYSYMSR